MRILYSQKDGEQILPRKKFREITHPVTRTFRSSKLLTKIFFYKAFHFKCKDCGRHNYKDELRLKDRFKVSRPNNSLKDFSTGKPVKSTRIFTFYSKEDIPLNERKKAKFIRQGTCEDCGSINFEKKWNGNGTRGNFRCFADHGFYNNETKFFNQGIRAVITLKLWPNITPEQLFSVFAHEFFHWRQSNAVYYGRGRYSEKKAYKWQKKMTNKYYPEYYDKRWGEK